MNPPSADRLLGEYRLLELLAENPVSRTWLAEQVSVSRRVLLDELRPEQAHLSEAFIADVRAKAAIEHPLIGSVYEAVHEPGMCFFAHEFLPGATFADRSKASEPFKPVRLVHLLRRIAEAHHQHEALGQATSPIRLTHIHLDDQGVIRLDNLAIAGQRSPQQTTRDIAFLGQALQPLVADGQPGSTRMLTLLGWMRGIEVDELLSWDQVRDTCSLIEHQLADPLPPASPTKYAASPRKKSPPYLVIVVVAILALVAGFALVTRLHPKSPSIPSTASRSASIPPPPTLPDDIVIPTGKYPTPDGGEEEFKTFSISAHEVTIGQFAEFIDTLETLAKNHRESRFDHENQPPEKTSHLPDDWPALFAAAKSGGLWNGRQASLDSPVVGVDWWDAAAYAKWKQAQLPTQEEWFAALRLDGTPPESIKPSTWLPVTAKTSDRTPRGMLGMAGSVAEWTRCQAVNPANPLGQHQWVIIGGSYLKPGTNALTREWTDNRLLRRPDLGFRVVANPE